jgi:hypothetical protein
MHLRIALREGIQIDEVSAREEELNLI